MNSENARGAASPPPPPAASPPPPPAMSPTSLFRQSALQRISSPEQLDRALVVTTSKGWLAAVVLIIGVVAVGFWSIAGEVSTYVNAHGILLNRGGTIVDAVTLTNGTLTDVVPIAGDLVQKGAVVATVENVEAAERYRNAVDLVNEREQALQDLVQASAEEDALVGKNIARQRQRLEQLERSGRQTVAAARRRLEDHQQLFEEQVVTRLTTERSQQVLDRAQQELFDTVRRLDDLEARELQRRQRNELRLSEARAHLRAAERRKNELDVGLDVQRVLSPAAGRVTEIKATIGGVLRPGQPVLSIETGADRLEVLLYVPPADGKKVEPGMEALVSPSTVRREEHGSVKGVVLHVSAFPASLEGMIASLQNRSLAQSLAEEGQPYAGRVALATDPSTTSGFAWTSPKGAGQELTSGTIATAEIKTGSQAPITLVIPLIRKTFGL